MRRLTKKYEPSTEERNALIKAKKEKIAKHKKIIEQLEEDINAL